MLDDYSPFISSPLVSFFAKGGGCLRLQKRHREYPTRLKSRDRQWLRPAVVGPFRVQGVEREVRTDATSLLLVDTQAPFLPDRPYYAQAHCIH